MYRFRARVKGGVKVDRNNLTRATMAKHGGGEGRNARIIINHLTNFQFPEFRDPSEDFSGNGEGVADAKDVYVV